MMAYFRQTCFEDAAIAFLSFLFSADRVRSEQQMTVEARRGSSRTGQLRLSLGRKRSSHRCTALGLVSDLMTGRVSKCDYPVAYYSRCWKLALVKRWSDNIPSQLNGSRKIGNM